MHTETKIYIERDQIEMIIGRYLSVHYPQNEMLNDNSDPEEVKLDSNCMKQLLIKRGKIAVC